MKDRITEIAGKVIHYRYLDNFKGMMDEVDIEHVKKCVLEGYVEGELHTTDPKNPEKDHPGWWEVDKREVQ